MGWFTGIVLYIIIWWTTIFAVLPWGLRHDPSGVEGTQGGAPSNPNIKRKFWITTVVSAVIWIIVYVLVRMDIIDFRAIAEAMMIKDMAQ